jgi:hypothetical protein
MKFIQSTLFHALSNGASKFLQWKVYVRKVTDLTEDLATGTAWTDVTDRIEDIPTLTQKSELENGIPMSNSISLTAMGVIWWEANVFNATASETIEIKIECKLGLSASVLATDIAYEFSGFIEKKYTAGELADSLAIKARTLDDILETLPGEYLTLQPKYENVRKRGRSGLVFNSWPLCDGCKHCELCFKKWSSYNNIHGSNGESKT